MSKAKSYWVVEWNYGPDRSVDPNSPDEWVELARRRTEEAAQRRLYKETGGYPDKDGRIREVKP